MRTRKIVFILFILLFPFIHTSVKAQERILTKDDFAEDIQYMFNTIKNTYPNYQQITPEKKWLDKKTELINSIIEPVSVFDYYYKLHEYANLLRDAHSTFDMGRLRRNYKVITPNDTILPFTLYFIKNRAFVKFNFSKTHLPANCEILEINNRPIDSLIRSISKYVNHENDLEYRINGYQENSGNLGLRVADILNYLGITSPYNLKFRDNKTLILDSNRIIGIRSSELLSNIKSKGEKEKPIALIEIDKNTALLNINTFNSSYYFLIAGGRYSERKSNRILKKARKYQNLIIDVRRNGGGDPKLTYNIIDNLINGNYNVHKEIINKALFHNYPYRRTRALYKDYYHLKNQTVIKRKIDYLYRISNDPNQKLINTDSLFNDIQRRNRRMKKYNGNVYVLMGNGSYSATIAFLDLIKHYTIGLTIGESTGGYRSVTYYNLRNILPKSLISFGIRTTYKLPLIGGNLSEPITPHLYKPCPVEDFLNEKDSQLDYVLELIEKGITIKNYNEKLKIE